MREGDAVATATAVRPVALNQMIALRKGVTSDTHSTVTRLHHEVQKANLTNGFARTYRRINDEDADLPAEGQRVQLRANDVLLIARDALVKMFDVTAAIDWTNQLAKADIVVGDQVIVKDAPVSFLLFLEKQLVDIATFAKKLPVLDPAESWRWDDNADAWASERTTTIRTRKVMRNHEIAAATDKHPAQVSVYQEDVPVGYWDTVKFSGAVDGARVKQLLERIRALSEAVKVAREAANMTPVVQPRPGTAVFEYLFAR
jgi:hypothetical protein